VSSLVLLLYGGMNIVAYILLIHLLLGML
jgi:hypothetical protein